MKYRPYATRKRGLSLVGLIALLTVFLVILPGPSPVSAVNLGEDGSQQALAVSTPQPPSPPEGAEGEEEEKEPGLIGSILHTIFISSSSLFDVWTEVMDRNTDNYVDSLEPELIQATIIIDAVFNMYTSDGLEGITVANTRFNVLDDRNFLTTTKDVWATVFNVAVTFFPLVILVNVGGPLTSGVSAPVARAEMLEGLVKALGTLAFCALSFLIGSFMVRIGWGLSEQIRPENTALYWAGLRAWVPILGVTATRLSLFGFFLVFLVVTVNLLFYAALILSHYAVITITVALLVLGPMIIVIGNIKPFSWLYWMWLKAFTAVLLMPAANAVLLRLWSSMGILRDNALSPILSAVLSLGFLSLLITLNFTIGKLVFQPMMEATQKAWSSAKKTFKVVVGIATAAIGAAAGAGAISSLAAATPGGSSPGGGGGTGSFSPPGMGGGMSGNSESHPSGANPYNQATFEGRRAALRHNEKVGSQVNHSRQIASAALRNHPTLQTAFGSVFGSQGQQVLADKHAIQESQDSMGDFDRYQGASKNSPDSAGEAQGTRLSPRGLALKSRLTNTCEYFGSIHNALSKGHMGDVGFRAGDSIDAQPVEKWRDRAVNAAGHFSVFQETAYPDYYEPLEMLEVSREAYLASLAYQSMPGAFDRASDLTKTGPHPTRMTSAESLGIINKIAEELPDLPVGQDAALARELPIQGRDYVLSFFDRLLSRDKK